MSKTAKILLSVISFQIIFLACLFIPLSATFAYDMQVDIPGLKDSDVQADGTTKAIGNYIKGIYNYAIGIVAIVATIIMMMGGFSWIMAGGNAEGISDAKAWITAALSGLVLALASYTILSFVNPDLVNFKTVEVKKIEDISKGYCFNNALPFCMETARYECEKLKKEGGGDWDKLKWLQYGTCMSNSQWTGGFNGNACLVKEDCVGCVGTYEAIVCPDNKCVCFNP